MMLHTGCVPSLSLVIALTAVGALSGCGGDAPAAPLQELRPVAEPKTAEPAPLTGETAVSLAAAADNIEVAQQTVDTPADDDVPEARNPLIRGVQKLLDTALGATDSFDEEREDLGQSLIDADSMLTRIKQENRSAIRQASRQVRIPGPGSPNLILIVGEGFTSQQLSCYQPTAESTPNIDRLAADGIRFTAFRTVSAEARLSRWSLMTGLELNDDTQPTLDPEHWALGEVMWQAGYATGFIGLWGIPESASRQGPNAHGFDEWLGYFRESEPDTDYPEFLWSNSNKIRLKSNADGGRGQSAREFLLQETLSFIERHLRGRPYFLTVVLTPPAGTEPAQAAATLDRDVAKIMTRLSELQDDVHTAVCFTSTAHSNGADARLPLIFRWPARIRSGRTTDRPAGFDDLLPTFADAVRSIRRPQRIDGRSLLSTLTADPQLEEPIGD